MALAFMMFRSPPYGVWGALVVMLMRKKSALLPAPSVQLTVTFTTPLISSERPTQESVGTEGGPECEQFIPYIKTVTSVYIIEMYERLQISKDQFV